MKNRCNKIDAKKASKDAIGAIVGAIKALKDAKTEIWGDAKLGLLQIRALAMSLTGDHAAKATRSELGRFTMLTMPGAWRVPAMI